MGFEQQIGPGEAAALGTIIDKNGFIVEHGHPQEGCLLEQSMWRALTDAEREELEAAKAKAASRLPFCSCGHNALGDHAAYEEVRGTSGCTACWRCKEHHEREMKRLALMGSN